MLTPRQRWLLDYVTREARIDNSRWIPLKEIVEAMDCDLSYCEGDNYRINSNHAAHNPCPALWSDKEAINADPTVETPLIYNNYALKIPSSLEELDEYYANDLEARARKMLWRMGVVRNKARKDGQMAIEVDAEGNPTERFIEAVIRKSAMEIAQEKE